MEDSIVITGIGIVSPAGDTTAELWEALETGTATSRRVTGFDTSDLDIAIGCQAREGDLALLSDYERGFHRGSRYVLVAARRAMLDAGQPAPDPDRGSAVIGAAGFGLSEFDFDQMEGLPALAISTASGAAPVHSVMASLGWTGHSLQIASACSSGSQALGEGAALLRSRVADVVLAGGTDATVNRMALLRFAQLKALASGRSGADRACRPFDRARDGCVVGEGAGVCVLEREADAVARGARIHARLAGYWANNDAHHIVLPSAAGPATCMREALVTAGLRPSDISYVNAHGTATRQNDLAEAEAIRAVFGDDHPPPVTSLKGVLGHMMGAAGAAEAIGTCLSFHERVIPPTANHEETDPRVRLDVVAGEARPFVPGPVLSNSFAFGGQNATVVLSPA